MIATRRSTGLVIAEAGEATGRLPLFHLRSRRLNSAQEGPTNGKKVSRREPVALNLPGAGFS